MNIDLNFKIHLSKKQAWEMSQLDKRHHLPYLLSFIGSKGFQSAYTNLSNSIPNPTPFEKLRPHYKHFDRLKGGTIHYHKFHLKNERTKLLKKIPISKLKKIVQYNNIVSKPIDIYD